jgi:UDP-2,4-diacetamido-2,4,6-trideoxy-beta-L-altropyranose hydrolase
MQVLIRSDASFDIGSGHVMRCIALADALRAEGAKVSFASRELPGHLCDLVSELGFKVTRLRGPDAGNPTLEAELNELCDAIGDTPFDWLVVDHYSIDAEWERRARACCKHILAIDDLADRHHDCDILLDQNFSLAPVVRYEGLLPLACEKLLGPRYALLRPEFAAARAQARERDGSVRRIFVFFGGSDSRGETLKVLDAVARLADSRLAFTVVIGRSNPHVGAIQEACAALTDTMCVVGSNDMATLMAESDLAIGAGGSTTWERCCVALPSIIVAIADNQVPGSRDLHHAGYAQFLGTSQEVTSRSISEAVQELMADPLRVRALSLTSGSLVDGRGAERVANSMLATDITLRQARDEDCDQVYSWRNHAETRRFSNDPNEISVEAHRLWYHRKLGDPSCELIIGELGGSPIGVLRYDLQEDQAVVSIYLVPGRQGRGLGRALLHKGSQWLSAVRPGIKRVSADVLQENRRSASAFEASGFRFDGERYHRTL